jgi:hypothetical protein
VKHAGRGASFVAFVAMPLVVGSTWAGATPSARLVYSRTTEAAACPEEAELRSAVSARFGYDPFFPSAKQVVIVQISRPHARYVARVQLLDEQGITHGARELSSDQRDCAEIVDAVALAITIALDAASKSVPSSEPPEATKALPAPTVVDHPPPAAASSAALAPAVAPSLPPEPPRNAPAETSASQLLFDTGIDVLGSLGMVPSVATPGVSAFARGRAKAWSLSIEVRGDLPESAGRPAARGGGRVEAWLASASLAPCFHAGYVDACALAMLGSLQASGLDIDPRLSKTAVFAAAGVRLGVEWPRSAKYALRLHVDGVANLARVRLLLGQAPWADEVWAAPPFAGTLGAGVVARFP